ncbi:hypothetical protein [Cupriavidus sp. IDO]|uniref:hypothetical protein n=1 Tax=Cupriavidus sp. IDO TaxID=1539142 RepID=UPI000B236B24|nr:hypothetical protein [Cupriavidus sp. IDO]
MNVMSHTEKLEKLMVLRQRLDPLQDFELWFWAGMTAGTHAVNAALHQAQITADDDVFPTQPGVYLAPQGDGSLQLGRQPPRRRRCRRTGAAMAGADPGGRPVRRVSQPNSFHRSRRTT